MTKHIEDSAWRIGWPAVVLLSAGIGIGLAVCAVVIVLRLT